MRTRLALAAVVAMACQATTPASIAQTESQGRCGLAPGTPRPEGITVDNPFSSMAWVVLRDSFCASSILGMQNLRVSGAPRHGTLELSGTRYTYRPEAGYVGPDAFTISFMMHDYRTARGAVQVTVTVVP